MGTSTLKLPTPGGAENIMVAWICPGDVTNSFASSIVDTVMADPRRRIQGRLSLQSSPRIVQARTELVDAFLHTGHEWLFMVDADMAWQYEDFDRLARAADKERRPIIGGLCFGGGRANERFNVFPTLYNISKDEDGNLTSDYITDYPKNKIVEVSATGAAFLLVHRRVLIHMLNTYGVNRNPFPWFDEIKVTGKPLGEDITFCVRATSIGYKIFVHTGVKIGHEKRYLLTEELYDDNRRTDQRDRQGTASALHAAAVGSPELVDLDSSDDDHAHVG